MQGVSRKQLKTDKKIQPKWGVHAANLISSGDNHLDSSSGNLIHGKERYRQFPEDRKDI